MIDFNNRHLFTPFTHPESGVMFHTDGGMHKGGGPQYFQAVTVGGNIWVVYSIGKSQVGLTRIPLAALERLEKVSEAL